PSRLGDSAHGKGFDRRRLVRERRPDGDAAGEQAGDADEHRRRNPLQADLEAGGHARCGSAGSDLDHFDDGHGSAPVFSLGVWPQRGMTPAFASAAAGGERLGPDACGVRPDYPTEGSNVDVSRAYVFDVTSPSRTTTVIVFSWFPKLVGVSK